MLFITKLISATILYIALVVTTLYFVPNMTLPYIKTPGLNNLHMLLITTFSIIYLIYLVCVIINRKKAKPKKQIHEQPSNETNNDDKLQLETIVAYANAAIETDFKQAQYFIKKHKLLSIPSYIIISSTHTQAATLINNKAISIIDASQFVRETSKGLRFIFTDQAIFISITPSEFNGKDSLTSLAHHLASYHRKFSLDGGILCTNLTEVETSGSAFFQQCALLIDHIRKTLAIELAWYYIISDLSSIRGYQYFFTGPQDKIIHDILGVTLDRKENDLIQSFTQRYLQLGRNLGFRLLQKLQHANNPTVNRAILFFPRYFLNLQAPIENTIKTLFSGNPYRRPHCLRGVYFTNGSELADSLFVKLILKEHGVINYCRYKFWEIFSLRITGYLFITGLFIGTSYLWVNSYELNKSYLHKIDVNSSNLMTLANNDALFEKENTPRAMHWGLFTGNRVKPILQQAYVDTAHPTMQRILEKDFNKRLKHESGMALYRSLMIYLMLGDPARKNNAVLNAWFLNHPIKFYPNDADLQTQWEGLFLRYINEAKQPITLDPKLVSQAREKLNSLSSAQIAYLQLQEEAQKNKNTSLYNSVNFDGRVFINNNVGIPFLFTAQGYKKVYLTSSTKVLADSIKSDWVLGRQANLGTNNLSLLKSQLDSLYTSDYINAWQKSLNKLQVAPLSNLQRCTQAINLLAHNNSPIEQVLLATNQATNLGNSTKVETNITDAFANINELTTADKTTHKVPYQSIQAAFIELDQYLITIAQADNPNQAAYNAVKSNFSGQGASLHKLTELAYQSPQPVRQWLLTIVHEIKQALMRTAQVYMVNSWQQ